MGLYLAMARPSEVLDVTVNSLHTALAPGNNENWRQKLRKNVPDIQQLTLLPGIMFLIVYASFCSWQKKHICIRNLDTDIKICWLNSGLWTMYILCLSFPTHTPVFCHRYACIRCYARAQGMPPWLSAFFLPHFLHIWYGGAGNWGKPSSSLWCVRPRSQTFTAIRPAHWSSTHQERQSAHQHMATWHWHQHWVPSVQVQPKSWHGLHCIKVLLVSSPSNGVKLQPL
jgi:hypothetical protein